MNQVDGPGGYTGRLERYPREELVSLCERLGHDPNRVAWIVLYPEKVEVVYVHPVSDRRAP